MNVLAISVLSVSLLVFSVGCSLQNGHGRSLYVPDSEIAQEAPAELQNEMPRYTGKRVTVSLSNVPVQEAIHRVGELAGINIIVGPDVTGTMSLHFENVPWDQILDQIMRVNELDKEFALDTFTIRTLTWWRANANSAPTK